MPPPASSGNSGDMSQHAASRSVFQPGVDPQTMGQAYTPLRRGDGPEQTYLDVIADQKRVQDVSFI